MNTKNTEAKCPFSAAAGVGRTNRDWWPQQLRLDLLHQHSSKSDPMGKDFNYAEAFKHLDLVAVGMSVTRHPPHRSVRAELPHTALALGNNAKTLAAFTRTLSNPVDALSRLSVRHAGDSTAFPLAAPLSSTTSAGCPLFGGFFGTMGASDFSSA